MARPGWEIEEVKPDSSYDVWNQGRPVRYGEPSLTSAIQVVRRGGGTGYTLVETDGYQTQHRL